MRKAIAGCAAALALFSMVAFAGCSSQETQGTEDTAASEQSAQDQSSEGPDTLVVYFSQTGNTMRIAEAITETTGADTYRMEAEDPYSEEDVDYTVSGSRAEVEQSDPSTRVEIAGTPVSAEQYDVIYIGYPIWWGDAPRIVLTYIESQDLDGKTVIPFCTSSSSGITSSQSELEQAAPGANWIEGERFESSSTTEDVQAWISGLEV